MEKDNIALYLKEEEYKFFKLIATRNISGIITKTFKEYKVRAYIVNQSYNYQSFKVEDIQISNKLVGNMRIPAKSIDSNGIAGTIKLKNGDVFEINGIKYEVIQCHDVKEKIKHYYTFYLTNYFENIKFDKYKTELNTLFFNMFDKLNIEAVVYSTFFQNEYFKDCKRPFLTYEIQQIGKMDDFTSFIDVLNDNNKNKNEVRVKRRYRAVIRYYVKEQDIELELILSKNKIFEHILQDTSFKFKFIKDFEIQELSLLTANETIINDEVLNEKIYNLEFTADTLYSFERDFIERIKLTGKLKNKED